MYTSGKTKLRAAGVMFAGIVIASVGMSLHTSQSQETPIWRKDAYNVVRLVTSTLEMRVATLTEGGGVNATSTNDTTATLLASNFDLERVIEFTPNVTGITLSLPASTTLSDFVENAGECRNLRIANATTTAGAGVIIAGGTGSLLRNASTSATVLPGGAAELTACRKNDTDILWAMNNVI